MSGNGLSESDLELLSAWMDGELAADQAARVAGLVATEPPWRQAHREFLAIDAGLGAMPAPELRSELTDRIVNAARGQRRFRRIVAVAGSLAVAAAVVLAVWLVRPGQMAPPPEAPVARSPVEDQIDAALIDVPAEDRFIVRKLGFFREYPDLAEYRELSDLADAKTLSELAKLDPPEKY